MSRQVENINPYKGNEAKHIQIERMFDSIAPTYDMMNRLMTLGIDKYWRHRTVKLLVRQSPKAILDIATGTGDLAITIAKHIKESHVTGIDLSLGMINIGVNKVNKAGLADRVTLSVADALNLPFYDNTFDAVTVAFGVRNFEHLLEGYREIRRVLRPGGKVYVIELTTPASPIVKPFYNLYTRHIIPGIGRAISKDSRAYTYLPESIRAVPTRGAMTILMTQAGFNDANYHSMTLGTCTLYIASK